MDIHTIGLMATTIPMLITRIHIRMPTILHTGTIRMLTVIRVTATMRMVNMEARELVL